VSSKKKELKPGDVVCKKIKKQYADRLEDIGNRENAAQRMLAQSMQMVREIWNDLAEEYSLDRDTYLFSVDHKTGSITVHSRREKKD